MSFGKITIVTKEDTKEDLQTTKHSIGNIIHSKPGSIQKKGGDLVIRHATTRGSHTGLPCNTDYKI